MNFHFGTTKRPGGQRPYANWLGAERMQVVVPEHWLKQSVLDFAQLENKHPDGGVWKIVEKKTLEDTPGFVLVTLDA